jgi:4-amino-4-deoxy-L-arabinose transferase-like glycosyltransferase
MPLYPLQVALAMRLLGPTIWAARLVSVLGGLLTVVLTYRLGRDLAGPALGLLGAAALCVLRLAVPVPGEVERIGIDLSASGIPLLDLARVVRFDIWVPVWGLAACCLWLAARRAESGGPRPARPAAAWGDLAAGACVGLGTLTHVYAIFFLPLLIGLLLWVQGWAALRRSALYRLLVGFGLPLIPWVWYVAQDLYAFRGQMQPQSGRFDLLNPLFYLDNLLREPWRYLAWIGGSFRHPVLWPRLGVWAMTAGVALTTLALVRRARAGVPLPLTTRFLLVALPLLALLLAALINFKRYYYVLLVLPFVALYVAYAGRLLWRRARSSRPARAGLALAGLALLVEGAVGVTNSLEAAAAITPYQAVTGAFVPHLPADARLLVAEPLWMGLTRYDARAILLPFLLADERYYENPPGVEAVLGQLDPDYVLAQDYYLDDYLRPGAPFQNPASLAQWTALRDYLHGHCPAVVFSLADKDYGGLSLYRCAGASS